jgi:outer membrane lipoprotein
MMGRMRIVIMMAVVWLSGCAHVISTDIIEQVNTDIEFTSLLKAPQDYQGQMVLLGGIIVNTVNRADGTLLEVYQTRMDSTTGKPIDVDESQGRFLALYEGFLDGAIYRKGRKVTIAGIVTGERVMKIGQVDYHYPYLVIKEIYLWKEDQRYEPYPWDPWDPWWGYPWHPWDDPYWRCPKC